MSPAARTPQEEAARYDALHAAHDAQGLEAGLFAGALGEEFPVEIDPNSMCTWSVLGETVAGLRTRPDDVLVDLGCGRGGVGLWLARALSARLIGIDVSPQGVEIARGRVAEFFPGGTTRCEFRTGTFEETGLPGAFADAVVSIDALRYTKDQPAALLELKRILKPGARAVFTATWYRDDRPDWQPILRPWPEAIHDAGLCLVSEADRPELAGIWDRLLTAWETHETELRKELGDEETDQLLQIARDTRPTLAYLQGRIYTVRA